MNNLKTIKEIKRFNLFGEKDPKGELVSYLHLREEMYKWLLYLREHHKEYKKSEEAFGFYATTKFIVAFLDSKEE